MDLLEKLRAIETRRAKFEPGPAPGATVIERVLGPCEVVVNGRPTLMFGSNNYLGLTLHPDVVAAARDAVALYGTGTTGSRTANGTLGCTSSSSGNSPTGSGSVTPSFSAPATRPICRSSAPVRARRRRPD
jgi:hypothetical protein